MWARAHACLNGMRNIDILNCKLKINSDTVEWNWTDWGGEGTTDFVPTSEWLCTLPGKHMNHYCSLSQTFSKHLENLLVAFKWVHSTLDIYHHQTLNISKEFWCSKRRRKGSRVISCLAVAFFNLCIHLDLVIPSSSVSIVKRPYDKHNWPQNKWL